MKLQHVRVEQVRQFRAPVLLDGLHGGINLVHGPNESGKSTLVRAIRAAFFERYRSKSVEDLCPWGDSSAAPNIELAFEHDQQQWTLNKRFLQRKRCDLVVAGENFSGEEAEEKLADLLGYQFSRKGASKDEHWGIPGLLWVEQGTGQEIENAVGHAGEHLKSALNNLVGEVASSGGDDVIQAVEKQRAELLTATGKPRGDYQQLEKGRDALGHEITELDARIDQYQSQVDRLSTLAKEYDRARIDRPWDDARRKMEQAQTRYRQVEVLQNEQLQEQNTLEHIRNNLTLLRQHRAQIQAESDKLAQRESDRDKARQSLEQENARTVSVESRVDQARATYSTAEKTLDKVRRREKHARLERQLSDLKTQQQSLQRNLEKAVDYLQQRDECTSQSQQNQIEQRAVQELASLQRQFNEETIRSETIATRLTWQLQPDQSLQLNGQPIDGQGEQRLLDESTLEIAGVGTLGITPGGGDLASARRTLAELQKRLKTQRQDLKVQNLEEAEARLTRYLEAKKQAAHLEELLKSVAPDGYEQLRAQAESVRADMEKCRAELAEHPAVVTDESGDLPGLASADSAFEAAGVALTEAESRQRDHEKAVLTARQNLENANREWQKLKDELEAPDRAQRLKAIDEELQNSEKREVESEKALRERETSIQQARPDLQKQDIERYQRTAETQEKAQQNRERELRDIRVRLEAWGAEGLEEQRNEKVAALEHNDRRFSELHRRAQALDLLLNLLTEKRRALTRRLQAPLQKHLDHYLWVLFPEATLEVDEHLVPRKFTRGSELGEMAELSFGAREQMGLMSRLAYADLLQEAGRPTLIILDDTLVHADAERLDGMKRILFDAAHRHQILLFTCHPQNWEDLGVEPIDMESLKTQVSA